jgi:hypothetical protein
MRGDGEGAMKLWRSADGSLRPNWSTQHGNGNLDGVLAAALMEDVHRYKPERGSFNAYANVCLRNARAQHYRNAGDRASELVGDEMLEARDEELGGAKLHEAAAAAGVPASAPLRFAKLVQDSGGDVDAAQAYYYWKVEGVPLAEQAR